MCLVGAVGRRYIDFLILLIPIPLVSALFVHFLIFVQLCSICWLTDQVRILPFRREFQESFWWLTDSGIWTRCNSCEENTCFHLVDPLPREETKASPSFIEIQAG